MTSLLVKIYYRDEVEYRPFNSLVEAVHELRAFPRGYEIGCAFEREQINDDEWEQDAVFLESNVTRDLEAMWIQIERQDLEEEYYRTNPPDITLEAFLDRATGPVFRKPSEKRGYGGRGFNVAQIAAE